MIHAKELRIRNLLNYDRFGESRIVIIDHDHIRMCFDFNDEFNLYYKPIPITEEWLLKFGFEKGNNINVPINVYSLNLNLDGIYSIIKYDVKNKYVHLTQRGVSVYLKELENIHQLQNLYFALTQKELTLND